MKKIVAACKGELLLTYDGACGRLPREDEVEIAADAEIFRFGDFIAVSPRHAGKIREGIEMANLRENWGRMHPEEFLGACKGLELLNWNEEERYCARDGHLLERFSEISKRCPECGCEYFPRLSPAVVVLVKKGEEALLVHANTLRKPVMALVAGFVETGESLEECVRREVMEETSLEIDDIRYYGSQSWPYPHQLMVGFTARYKGGEIHFADGELSAGGFFTRQSPPPVPSYPSLSRQIIDAWIKGEI